MATHGQHRDVRAAACAMRCGGAARAAARSPLCLRQAFFAPLVATMYGMLINQNLLVMGAGASEAATVLSHPAGVWASVPQPDITTPEVIPCSPSP